MRRRFKRCRIFAATWQPNVALFLE